MRSSESKWIFIVDTHQDAKTFADRLCAFCTGHSLLDDGANFDPDIKNIFNVLLEYQLDSSGIPCPWSLWETPGWFYDGFGLTYKVGSISEEEIRKNKERRIKHFREKHKLHIPDQSITDFYDNPIDFPAMQSVAFFFRDRPDNDLVDFVARKAKEFADKENIPLQSFRLLEKKITTHLEFFSLPDKIVY